MVYLLFCLCVCFYMHTDMLNPYIDQKFHVTIDLRNLVYLKLNQITTFS